VYVEELMGGREKEEMKGERMKRRESKGERGRVEKSEARGVKKAGDLKEGNRQSRS